MPVLYHFSEEPGIEVFEPRGVAHRPDVEPVVWTVDAEHQQAYLFPRDCPRALLWAVESTTAEDHERWFGRSEARVIAHVEYAWLDRIRATTLYRYELPSETFEPLEDDAWMWVSRATVTPARVEVLDDLFEAMRAAGVELRAMDRLTPLIGVWEETTLHWSGIRLRHARDWPSFDSPAPESIRRKA